MNNKSEQRRYRVSCSDSCFTSYTLHWLNRRGGFDTYTFRLKSTRTTSNEKKEWARFLSSYQPNNTWGYKLGDRGRSVYNSKSFETVTAISVWLTEAENIWLEELMSSTEVYLLKVLNDKSLIPIPDRIPVVVGNRSIEMKDKKGPIGGKLFSWTIEFTYANDKINQRG